MAPHPRVRILWEIAKSRMTDAGLSVVREGNELVVAKLHPFSVKPMRLRIVNGRVSQKTVLTLIKKAQNDA